MWYTACFNAAGLHLASTTQRHGRASPGAQPAGPRYRNSTYGELAFIQIRIFTEQWSEAVCFTEDNTQSTTAARASTPDESEQAGLTRPEGEIFKWGL